jgi:hypothetical protein
LRRKSAGADGPDDTRTSGFFGWRNRKPTLGFDLKAAGDQLHGALIARETGMD